MSVPAGTARAIYYGSGSPGPFAFNFKLYATSHLRVVKTDLSGIETVLVETTDYVVSLAADFGSATVLLVADLEGDGDPSTSEQLTLIRNPPISQLIEWPRTDPFPSATHERAADLAVMLIDRLNEKIGRSILLPESATVTGLTLPNPEAELFLRWNATADALENMAIADAGGIAVSAYMLTVLDDADAAAARATLGAMSDTQIISLTTQVSGALPIANGGTGQTTAALAFAALKQAATDSATGVVELATDAEVRSAASGTAGTVMSASQLESAAAPVTLTDATTIAVDWDTFINGVVTLGGNRTLGNPTNGQPGTWRRIQFNQDGTGSRTITWGNQYVHPGGTDAVLSTAANAVDTVYIYCRSTTVFEVHVGGKAWAT